TWMPDRDTVDFLATVPLLDGREEADLAELARVMRRRTVSAGETLWRPGDDAREMLFVVDGAVSVLLELPGHRTMEFGTVGPGQDPRGDRAARRRRAHDERPGPRDRDRPRARARGLRGAAGRAASEGAHAQAPPARAARRPPAQPAPVPRRLARRRAQRPAAP